MMNTYERCERNHNVSIHQKCNNGCIKNCYKMNEYTLG